MRLGFAPFRDHSELAEVRKKTFLETACCIFKKASDSYFLIAKKTINKMAISTSKFSTMMMGMYCDSLEG